MPARWRCEKILPLTCAGGKRVSRVHLCESGHRQMARKLQVPIPNLIV
jgi:hypothetical protein